MRNFLNVTHAKLSCSSRILVPITCARSRSLFRSLSSRRLAIVLSAVIQNVFQNVSLDRIEHNCSSRVRRLNSSFNSVLVFSWFNVKFRMPPSFLHIMTIQGIWLVKTCQCRLCTETAGSEWFYISTANDKTKNWRHKIKSGPQYNCAIDSKCWNSQSANETFFEQQANALRILAIV